MNNVLLGVLKEELVRNQNKQEAFNIEINKNKIGSLIVSKIHGGEYLYNKYRKNNKIICEYIGKLNSDASKKAFENRLRYLRLKSDLKDLKNEEKELRRLLKKYE